MAQTIFGKIASILDFIKSLFDTKSTSNAAPPATRSSDEEKLSEPTTPFGRYIFAKLDNYVNNLPQALKNIETELTKELQTLSREEIVPPNLIALRAFQEFRLNDYEHIKKCYLNIIIACLKKKTTILVHPAFVEVMKQLSNDELSLIGLYKDKNPLYLQLMDAIVNDQYVLHDFSFFHTVNATQYFEHVDMLSTYIDNLVRLGIIRMVYNSECMYKSVCELLRQSPQIIALQEKISKDTNTHPVFIEKRIEITAFGKQFIDICFN